MIRVKRGKTLSAKTIAAFGPQTRKEWTLIKKERGRLYNALTGLWTFSIDGEPVCAIGLCRYSLLGFGGEAVFFLCEGFHKHVRRMLPFIKRALYRVVRLWRCVCVRVDNDFPPGHRFVKFFGFSYAMPTVNASNSPATLYELRV
jgi:hypothetical protein